MRIHEGSRIQFSKSEDTWIWVLEIIIVGRERVSVFRVRLSPLLCPKPVFPPKGGNYGCLVFPFAVLEKVPDLLMCRPLACPALCPVSEKKLFTIHSFIEPLLCFGHR